MTDKNSTQVTEGAPDNSAKEILNVPIQVIVDYLNGINEHAKCTFCNIGDYGVLPAPTGGTAAVVAAPVPNVQHVGVWFYLATCVNCGNTIMLNARHVLAKMKSES